MAVRRELNPGLVKCLGLGCTKTFMSCDKATNRLCPTCSKKRDEKRSTRVCRVVGVAEPE